jgi:hypothetical protein
MTHRRYKRVMGNGTVKIDGTIAESWFVSVTGNATLATKNLIAGRLYVFVIEQIGGAHRVQFSGVQNAARVMPITGATSVQTFIAIDELRMQAIAPGAWRR